MIIMMHLDHLQIQLVPVQRLKRPETLRTGIKAA
jgi:hypothetical protein